MKATFAPNQFALEVIPERVGIFPCGRTENKDAVITRIAEVLSEAYRRPDPNDWLSRIRWRESFGTTGTGRHFALLHDFQRPDETVETANVAADLWLFLFPNGVNWESLDEQPVSVIACPIFARGGDPGVYLSVLSVIQRAWVKVAPKETVCLAAMSAAEAADWVNALLFRKVGVGS